MWLLRVSKKKADGEAEWETEERKRRRCIWVTGRNGLTEYEAAEMIIDEAKKLLGDDLIQMGVDWKPTDNPGMLCRIQVSFFQTRPLLRPICFMCRWHRRPPKPSFSFIWFSLCIICQ